MNWQSFPVRTCNSSHECSVCHGAITFGQHYYDGGINNRAHMGCAINPELSPVDPQVTDLLAQRDELREALAKIEIAASSPSFKVMHHADALGELIAEIHRLSAHALAKCEPQQPPKGISDHPFGNANCTCPNLPCPVHAFPKGRWDR